MTTPKEIVRVAALGDLHYPKIPQEVLQGLLTQATEQADVLLLCGDLTDYGQPDEAQRLAQACITYAKIPTLGVLGNHDYQSGQHEEVWKILCDAGIIMLDGDACEIRGIGFAGVKGFGGGFGQWALQPWGEAITKQFVHEAVNEAVELESALAKLRTPQRIVVLHYSPIRDTVVGEPPEIFAFLGSSRLEEPLNRYAVTAVFHGHAHHGTPEGQTTGGFGLQCRSATTPQDVSHPPAVSPGRDSGDAAVGRETCRVYRKPRDWKHWPHRFAAVYSARYIPHGPKPCRGRVRHRHA
jgi:Icc-related predicted phosphoesterase